MSEGVSAGAGAGIGVAARSLAPVLRCTRPRRRVAGRYALGATLAVVALALLIPVFMGAPPCWYLPESGCWYGGSGPMTGSMSPVKACLPSMAACLRAMEAGLLPMEIRLLLTETRRLPRCRPFPIVTVWCCG